MKKKIKIQGICPYCGAKDSIDLYDYYYGNYSNKPYAEDIPVCRVCGSDEIEIRKINNRRYKIVGKW